MSLSHFRCFSAEDRRFDTQVYNTLDSCTMGSVRLGFDIYLGFCHVYILFKGALQKVGFWTIRHISCIIYKRWWCLIAASYCTTMTISSYFYLILLYYCMQKITPPSPEAILVILCAVIFSLHIADCSHIVWNSLIISPKAQFGYCGVFFPPSNNVIFAPRRSAYDWMYTTPAVLPYGFHIFVIINICLNITWLFLFDRE